MKHMLQICCKNNNISKEFPIGSSLLDIYYGFNLNFPYQVVSAKVNNRSEGLNFRVYNNKDVEFLDIRDSSGMREPTAQTAAHCALGEINRKLSVPLIRRSFHMTVGIGIAHAASILFGNNVGIKVSNGANAFGKFFCCRQRVFKRNR